MNEKILILAAMPSEINYLTLKFEKITEEEIKGYKCYKTNIKNNEIYFLLTQVGEINSSISTTKAILKIHPNKIINIGTAGAHKKNLKIGDLIIGEEIINMNSIITPFKKLNEGSNSLFWNITNFISDSENKLIKLKGDENLIKLIEKVGIKYNINLIKGIISSGDIWNKEIDRINYFNEKYNSLCEEMEAYGIYYISIQENIPVIALKVISNNELNGEKFDKNSAIKLQDFVYNILNEI